MNTNAVKSFVFHGENRPKSPEHLVNHDIVLTTYATLASDHKKQSILQHIQWYRVVLDEGWPNLSTSFRLSLWPRFASEKSRNH